MEARYGGQCPPKARVTKACRLGFVPQPNLLCFALKSQVKVRGALIVGRLEEPRKPIERKAKRVLIFIK